MEMGIGRVMRRLLTACEPFSPAAIDRAKRRAYARLWAAWMGWDFEVKPKRGKA